jgi:hypothetical protein
VVSCAAAWKDAAGRKTSVAARAMEASAEAGRMNILLDVVLC